MPKKTHNILKEKWKESISSVLPITVLVFLICFFLIPVPTSALLAFVMGAVLLILGMGAFTLGADLSMTPIGEAVGRTLTKSKKVWVIALIAFLVGILITISEPDLQVLAEQVPGVPNLTLILAVAIGVGLFLVVALLRILLKVKMRWLLLGFYALVFLLAQFVPRSFLAVAFDAGGVTTGPMTVPFILALGLGVSSIRNDADAENDSFGLVALCSIGPILAVMLLGLIYRPEETAYSAIVPVQAATSVELWRMFASELPRYLQEVGLALAPIVIFFLAMHFTTLHLRPKAFIRILIGLIYTYLGLVLFLLGVNVGFMPVGNYIGQLLGALSYNWILVPLGMIIGFFVVSAEPAVHVLAKQVYELTAGSISKKSLTNSLCIGVSVSVGLSMMRVITGLPVMYLLVPGYLIAMILMFFVPPIFTSIAFDSGGVASGPMTATFLLPLAMGACTAVGGDIAADAFGVVAMVAMTPLITIQILGLHYKRRQRLIKPAPVVRPEENIIEL